MVLKLSLCRQNPCDARLGKDTLDVTPKTVYRRCGNTLYFTEHLFRRYHQGTEKQFGDRKIL